MIKGKKAGADMLMELALSAIIFFVIIFFLFGINIPKQKLNACAAVVSADATLACETSLMNLMKATSSDGTPYSDFLMNSWVKNQDPNDLTAWQDEVTSILDFALGATDWEMNITLPNGTDVASLGGIETQQLGCNYTMPFPAVLIKKDCGYSESKTPTVTSVVFDTPDGSMNFTVTDDNTWLGVDCISGCTALLTTTSVYEAPPLKKIPNDQSVVDSLTLPVKSTSGYRYDVSVEELSDRTDKYGNPLPKSGFAVNVTLSRSSTLQDCGLTVTLKTTNITDMVQTCAGKQITSLAT